MHLNKIDVVKKSSVIQNNTSKFNLEYEEDQTLEIVNEKADL